MSPTFAVVLYWGEYGTLHLLLGANVMDAVPGTLHLAVEVVARAQTPMRLR